jgi:hypothetical protein
LEHREEELQDEANGNHGSKSHSIERYYISITVLYICYTDYNGSMEDSEWEKMA